MPCAGGGQGAAPVPFQRRWGMCGPGRDGTGDDGREGEGSARGIITEPCLAGGIAGKGERGRMKRRDRGSHAGVLPGRVDFQR